MFESQISAGGVEKLPFPHNLRISSWSYDMAGHAKKCVERYCELANKSKQQLYKVSTPCIDDHHFKEEEMGSVGELSTICSQMFWNVFTWLVLVDPKSCCPWINLLDPWRNGPKLILQETLNTQNWRQVDSHVCSEAQHSCHTCVPMSWMCTKQTSLSHNSTEADIISVDAGFTLSITQFYRSWHNFCGCRVYTLDLDWSISFSIESIKQNQGFQCVTGKPVTGKIWLNTLSSKIDFIHWHFHPNTISFNDTFIQKQFHPMTLSSKTLSSNFDTFIQWHFHPKHFHPLTISSNEFLIRWHFHPMTFSTNNGFIQKITCGTINTVRVCVKASPAEGRRRLHTNTAYARLSGFNRPSSEASPAFGRRCFTWKPVETRKAGV